MPLKIEIIKPNLNLIQTVSICGSFLFYLFMYLLLFLPFPLCLLNLSVFGCRLFWVIPSEVQRGEFSCWSGLWRAHRPTQCPLLPPPPPPQSSSLLTTSVSTSVSLPAWLTAQLLIACEWAWRSGRSSGRCVQVMMCSDSRGTVTLWGSGLAGQRSCLIPTTYLTFRE